MRSYHPTIVLCFASILLFGCRSTPVATADPPAGEPEARMRGLPWEAHMSEPGEVVFEPYDLEVLPGETWVSGQMRGFRVNLINGTFEFYKHARWTYNSGNISTSYFHDSYVDLWLEGLQPGVTYTLSGAVWQENLRWQFLGMKEATVIAVDNIISITWTQPASANQYGWIRLRPVMYWTTRDTEHLDENAIEPSGRGLNYLKLKKVVPAPIRRR